MTTRSFVAAFSAAVLAANLPAAIPGHGLGWGTCEMAPGVIVTNITSSSSSYHNLAIRNDGTVYEFGNLDGPPTPPTNVIAIAAGGGPYVDGVISSPQYHSLAVLSDHSVVAWGDNKYGQTTLPSGLTNVVAVAAGLLHSVALKSNGKVVAWGNNGNQQTNVPAAASNVVAITAGTFHSSALRADGTVVCWGSLATQPAGLSNVIAIAAGYNYEAALRSDGKVMDWSGPSGSFPLGSLSNFVQIAVGGSSSVGNHLLALRNDGIVFARGNNTYGQSTVPAGLSNVIAIAAGDASSLALRSDGTVILWGIGLTNAVNQAPAALDDVVAVSAGAQYALALKRDGTVSDWCGNSTVPGNISDITAVSAGYGYGLALRKNATVLAWGDNSYGQSKVPFGLTNVSAIAAGTQRSLALKKDGTVVAWGATGPTGQVPAGLSNVVAIAFGCFKPTPPDGGGSLADLSLALCSNGAVVAWGNSTAANVPAGLTNVVAISAGGLHCLALLSDSTILGWGYNTYGEATGIPTPVPFHTSSTGLVTLAGQVLTNVVAVAAGWTHSLALKNDGTIVAWGQGYVGQTNVPSGLSNVVAIAAGYHQSLTIKADLAISSVGVNTQGRVIRFHTFAGQNYSVEYSPDLVPASWTPLPSGAVSGDGYDAQVTDSEIPDIGRRFYRLRLVQ